jgi:hypothetical protein
MTNRKSKKVTCGRSICRGGTHSRRGGPPGRGGKLSDQENYEVGRRSAPDPTHGAFVAPRLLRFTTMTPELRRFPNRVWQPASQRDIETVPIEEGPAFPR